MNERQQLAIATAKAHYEAQGYTVKTGDHELTAIKGIYKIWEGYHDNGQKAYICSYKNDKRHGKQESFYDNGQQEYIHNFKDGKFHGEQYEWNEDGTPLPTELWENDKFIKNI